MLLDTCTVSVVFAANFDITAQKYVKHQAKKYSPVQEHTLRPEKRNKRTSHGKSLHRPHLTLIFLRLLLMIPLLHRKQKIFTQTVRPQGKTKERHNQHTLLQALREQSRYGKQRHQRQSPHKSLFHLCHSHKKFSRTVLNHRYRVRTHDNDNIPFPIRYCQ